jgi:hypothetical protein
MIEPKDITKMVTQIVRRDNGKPESMIMHPMREWALGLLVVGLLVLWGVIFTIALYRVYSSSLETEVPIATVTIPYKAPQVADAIQYYENERTIYETLLGAPSYIGRSNTLPVPVATSTEMTAEDSVPTFPTLDMATSTPKEVPVSVPQM